MGKAWNIDVNAPLQAVVDDAECPEIFVRTLSGAVSWQVRNETSVWKALSSPRIVPQWVAALLALGAEVVLDDAPVPLETFLASGVEGMPSALRLEMDGKKWGEARVARTPADEPVVVAVAMVEMDGDTVRQARAALAGVWPEPVRLAKAAAQLAGGPLDEDCIRAAAEAVEAEVVPKGDFRGSEAYRRAMAGVLTRRALEQCLCQEVGDEG